LPQFRKVLLSEDVSLDLALTGWVVTWFVTCIPALPTKGGREWLSASTTTRRQRLYVRRRIVSSLSTPDMQESQTWLSSDVGSSAVEVPVPTTREDIGLIRSMRAAVPFA
jgi:hypothetical protein